ncbi:MAG: hydrophobe/amphiphile efflux-1 family RND transporter [Gammaproteobacteria bacterium 28-57-27]|nr:MAG: hydrophobe/amphiphile efflux-1 family RND transporter [Gammaproteobacteria bacterium 28-57-27]
MRFASFFVDRPIFAIVLSALVLIGGWVSLKGLPIEQYPEVVPPTIQVSTRYPGASPQTLSETVAAPIEQELVGIEHLLYMSSQSTADGSMSLTLTFEIGTDLDIAQMQVQAKVQNAEPRLPEEVRRQGVVTRKQSPDLMLVIHLISPDERYDSLFLGNYAVLNIRDQLKRVDGVGDTRVFGSDEYAMRIWLNPDQLAARNLTASDVVTAIRAQNVQVAAGSVGQPPGAAGSTFQLTVTSQSRLRSVEEFSNIIVRTETDGAMVRLGDVARLDLGAASYALRSKLDGQDAVAIPIFLRPGANALSTSEAVKKTIERLKQNFPAGVDYRIVYDTTQFVQQSIDAVILTFFEALLLVILVVMLFLQTWRAAIIPLIAVPVSIIGTFILLNALGFSINTLTLFGMVLAIGIVVDDAIVVIENVERHISEGMEPKAAARMAMEEVSGPIIAISLVLAAVFIPSSFISGINGEFYRQFGLTIAAATLISAFNSLTLSPALAGMLLKPHDAKPDLFTRFINLLFGWFFKLFNRAFTASSHGYEWAVKRLMRVSLIVLLVFGGLLYLTGQTLMSIPAGFIPPGDRGYLIGVIQLPPAASLERTTAVTQEAARLIGETPGVAHTVAFPGLSIVSFGPTSNAATIFVPLKPFSERVPLGQNANAIAMEMRKRLGVIDEAFVAVFPPPPIRGLGSLGGFKLQVQDRSGVGLDALDAAAKQVMAAGNAMSKQTPGVTALFTSFQNNVPQLHTEIDTERALLSGIPLQNIYDTLQINLGSLYVNDFNLFGRTYQVIAQAEGDYRLGKESIERLQTRNSEGAMAPLSGLVETQEITGPDRVVRYNTYPAIEINGSATPGTSSGEVINVMEKLMAETLPPGVGYEWTELTYLQIIAGNTTLQVFALSVLVVFLVLAALYESWSLPFAIILIMPMVILFAMLGVKMTGGDNNILTQVALLVLIGLASKNAILLVEFAKVREDHGLSAMDAALEACRLRLRPIIMTSIAFIAGVVPLVLATGAGAEMRQAIGTPVFFGMLGVTFFGLLLTPVFYLLIRGLVKRNRNTLADS